MAEDRSAARLRPRARVWMAALCLAASTPVHAQTLTVTVPLDYGTISAPALGSVTHTVGLADDASGTAYVVYGTVFTGQYEIRKGPGQYFPLFIDVAPTGSIPGLTIGSFTASYDGSPISLPASDLAGCSLQPLVHEQRATLAQLDGDAQACTAQLREAHRLLVEMGATGHAEKVAQELEQLTS